MSWDMSFNYLIKVLIEEISDISESPILPNVEIHNFLFSFQNEFEIYGCCSSNGSYAHWCDS